jgi:hypothetical protein
VAVAMFNKMDYKLWRSKQKQQKSAAKLQCLIGKMEQRKKKSAMRINASRNAEKRKWAIQGSKWA